MNLTSKIIFRLIGICIFIFFLTSQPPENLSENGWKIFGLMLVMAIWWVTETLPLSVTALLPLIFVPIFTDIEISEVARPYANPIIFLLLGGFIIGLGFQSSGLHLRMAILILAKIGSNKKNILAGFIISCAFLSMWISNTATCLLMLPILLTVLKEINKTNDFFFEKIMILSIAYASSIGGMSTLIGTAPNAIMAGFLYENYNLSIGFLEWMLFSLPLVTILLILFWFFANLLIKKEYFDRAIFQKSFKKLGFVSPKEKITFLIMILTILLWVFKRPINNYFSFSLSDTGIAIFGAFLFFFIPYEKKKYILHRDWYNDIPWNILILFGGGLSLASMIQSSGLAEWLGGNLGFLGNFNTIMVILLIAALISFLTEVTSNTATTLLFLPIVATFASLNNLDIILLTLPVVLTASCAFMMPIATPPNAIVFSTNKIKISFMIKIGICMNILAVICSSFWIFYASSILN